MARDFEDLHDRDDLSDDELRDLVREQLAAHNAVDVDDLSVRVEDGVVYLGGRVGTEVERRVAERVVTDVLGIETVENEILIDPIRRAVSPDAIDDHLADEEEHEGLLLGDRPVSLHPEAEHLEQDLSAELYGTTDLQNAIERGTAWVPPESPTPEGLSGSRDGVGAAGEPDSRGAVGHRRRPSRHGRGPLRVRWRTGPVPRGTGPVVPLASRRAAADLWCMPSAYLTRRVVFAAAHRYRRPEWSDERNEAVFGPCARPSFHGHSYTCDVTVRGAIDETTGFAADLAQLDAILRREVYDRFDHRNINVDVTEFADGRLVPTGENLARFIFERVQAALGDSATVTRVTVAEDQTLSATYQLD